MKKERETGTAVPDSGCEKGEIGMNLPKDPVILLSVINTELRDRFPTLERLAAAYMTEEKEIREKLEQIGYQYNAERNQFV